MPMPSTDPAAQLQWLVDRAAISDTILAFAHAIDTRDQPGYAALFTDDGAVVLPHGSYEGRAALLAMRGPPPEWSTLHVSANHRIELDGDAATVRAYVIATHVFAREKPSENASAGGWYDMALLRTPEGWRFRSIRLNIVWNTGTMVPKPF